MNASRLGQSRQREIHWTFVYKADGEDECLEGEIADGLGELLETAGFLKGEGIAWSLELTEAVIAE